MSVSSLREAQSRSDTATGPVSDRSKSEDAGIVSVPLTRDGWQGHDLGPDMFRRSAPPRSAAQGPPAPARSPGPRPQRVSAPLRAVAARTRSLLLGSKPMREPGEYKQMSLAEWQERLALVEGDDPVVAVPFHAVLEGYCGVPYKPPASASNGREGWRRQRRIADSSVSTDERFVCGLTDCRRNALSA